MSLDTSDFPPNSYSIIVSDLHIVAAANAGGELMVKGFDFPTWGGPELDAICQELAGVIRTLKQNGWKTFQFLKNEEVSATDLRRVADRIAELSGAVAESPYKSLN